MRAITFPAVALLLCSCEGSLTLPPLGANGNPNDEQDAGFCSYVDYEGTCPEERTCCYGVCAESCEQWSCDCPADQACVGGTCQQIDSNEGCSAQRPGGLCPWGDVCVGGQCVPMDETSACGQQNPSGLCPSGATCVNGYCVPTNEDPCGEDNLDGRCPSGQSCEPPGTCETQLCSPRAPDGACDAGDYCDGGVCTCIPCQPRHLSGCCSDGNYCSAIGACIERGSCADDRDCSFGAYCSVEAACISEGTCLADADCGEHYQCDPATSTCTRDYACEQQGDCLEGETCSAAGRCQPAGSCEQNSDCPNNQLCSVSGACIEDGTCLDPADCTGDTFCSAAGTCLLPGECAATADCRPGYGCDGGECVLSGSQCLQNGPAACVGASGEELWCCPTGDPSDCCPQGQRCSSDNICIDEGRCVDDSDCLAAHFECRDSTCVAKEPCTDTCPEASEYCSRAGGCIPQGSCVADLDCPAGEVCNALFECEPATGCGDQQFDTTLVPPNMLIVLDRSGSMDACISWSTSRWDVATEAINEVVTAHDELIRFGLSTYPYFCPGSPYCAVDSCCWYQQDCPGGCSDGCNWDDVCSAFTNESACDAYPPCTWRTGSCEPLDLAIADGSNAVPGDVDVPVGANHAAAVIDALSPPNDPPGAQYPGGWTPTATTLRKIAANRNHFGLPGAGDTQFRDNYILLVTDGVTNYSTGEYGVCDAVSDEIEAVNCALDALRDDATHGPVKTYPLGFIGVQQGDMNCHAVHGGTSRCATPSECASIEHESSCSGRAGCSWHDGACAGGVDESNCNDVDEYCFFNANDAEELRAALADIAGQVASCRYTLQPPPESASLVYLYLDYGCADIPQQATCDERPTCAWQDGSCSGTPVRLERDPSHADGWDYDPLTAQVELFGSTCVNVQEHHAAPVVILGCCVGEGC